MVNPRANSVAIKKFSFLLMG